MTRARAALIAIAALSLAGCGLAPDPDPAGVRPRIVSLNPCTDAVLAEVAAPGQLRAISHYSHDPSATSMELAKAARFAETSGAVEEIVALRPDVVVASAFLPPATAQALRDMGIKVVLEPMPDTVPEAVEQVRRMARLAGNRSAGERLAGRIDAALDAAAPRQGTAPVPAVMWQSGGIVAGEGTLIASLMERAGFANAAAARGLKQAEYLPLERVIADPPRVIFTVGSAVDEEDRMLRHPALAQVPGMARAPLDRSLVWCGGPTIPRALERLAEVRVALARGVSLAHREGGKR